MEENKNFTEIYKAFKERQEIQEKKINQQVKEIFNT